MIDLRCNAKKHGQLLKSSTDEGIVEFKCNSRWCGARDGVVVMHQFSTMTGRLVKTERFKEPMKGVD